MATSMKFSRLIPGLLVATLFSLVLIALPAHAQEEDDDGPDSLAERGEYLATIAGCIGCHTPRNDAGRLDRLNLMSGGRDFELGPLGVVTSRNLTPDEETGIGTWTDEEIKTAITTGVDAEGDHLFFTMPYPYFNNMAEDDLDAIVAFLRTLRPVENEIEHEDVISDDQLPVFERHVNAEPAPDPADTIARGRYLFEAVLVCSDCHTPADPETGLPDAENFYMAGGQAFEGPWGIVYSGNITPHDETGIGTWSDREIKRVLTTGVLPDGRETIGMPWEDYSVLTEDDLNAVIYYLRVEIEPIDRAVPRADLEQDFITFVDLPLEEAGTPNTQQNTVIIAMIVGGLIGLFIAGSLYANRQRQQPWQ